MRKLLVVLALGVGLSVNCGKPIEPIPSMPAVVTNVDQDVKAGAGKALGILLSASKIANTISLIETQAVAEKVVPEGPDKTFDSIMVGYTNVSDRAVKEILNGVESWDRLKALTDPVIAEANKLIEFINSLGALKTRAGEWGRVLKEIVVDLVPGLRPAVGGVR